MSVIHKVSALAMGIVTLALSVPALAQSTPTDFSTGYRYDPSRRLVGMIKPDPDGAGPLPFPAERYTYSVDGELTLVEKGTLASWQVEGLLPSAWTGFTVQERTSFSYDVRGIQNEARVTSGGTTFALKQMSYDTQGRLTCEAVRMDLSGPPQTGSDACLPDATPGSDGPDRITQNVYDAADQLTQVRKAVGTNFQQNYATFTYTLNGEKQTLADANGNLSTFVYDGFDRLVALRFPNAANGAASAPCNIGTISESAGVTGPSEVRNASDDCEKYAHDRNGNRATLIKRNGSILRTSHDPLNRVTQKTVPERAGLDPSHTRDVHYGYDLRGLQTFARFDSSSGDGVTSTYDRAGRLRTSALSMGTFSRQLTYDYDPAGNRRKITHPDNVYFQMDYDALSRMTQAQSWTPASGQLTQLMAVTYDAAGRRDDINRASSFTGYDYDGVSRLTTQDQRFTAGVGNVVATFGYNSASQIKTRSRDNSVYAYADSQSVNRNYAVNGLNQYSSTSTGAFYQYDWNGNLTVAQLTPEGTTNYNYDVENRLVSASGIRNATLKYDPLGRLFEVVGTSTTRFLYDGDALVAEYDGSNAMLRRYMHGPGVDEPILADEGAALNCSGTRVLHSDHQGSIIATADCWGNRQAVNTYDEYGVPGAANAGVSSAGRFAYTGQIYIPEVGLYHYKARAYSPTLGRFMQVDPAGYDDQVNLYTYVANDPLNNRDPDGEVIDTILDVGFIGYDVYKIATEGATTENLVALAADVGATFVPGVTGGGLAVRGANQNGRQTLRGSRNPVTREAAAQGRARHREFEQRIQQRQASGRGRLTGEQRIAGSRLRPDASRQGAQQRRRIELKPSTPSGIRAGNAQLNRYQRAEPGAPRGRLVCYQPGAGRLIIVPCGS